ncbi:hypothetical protein Hanom_Chr02g00168921 [Helianthus anomalus]
MIILTVLVVICHDNSDCRWWRRTLDAGQRWRMVVAQANSRLESYRVYSPRHGFPQHRRCFQAPGRCSNVDSRPICILPLPNRRFPRPSLRPCQPSVLQRMQHLRHNRLHFRQLSRCPSEV